ncbi:MAG: hypothetical protein ABI678_03730 [Kofleriaceae bacterium]
MRRLGSFLCVLALTSSADADVAKGPRVAVVPVAAVNLDAQRVDALAQDLAEGLNAELQVEAVGGLDVRRVLRADLQADCAAVPSCAADVARTTGASQILFVVMVDAGGTGSLQVDSTWVEPVSGKTENRPSVSLTSTIDADAKARFREAATKFLPDAIVRPKPKLGSAVSLEGRLVDGRPRHITIPAMVTSGAAVVGLGFGIGFGMSARSKYRTCEANKNTCSDAQKDTIRHHDLYADLGWVAAIGAAVATGVIFVTSSEAPHVIASPTETGVGASVSYVGRF